jgi:ElaB/YqjD/DUF883 family membrane-anchored ribosome-binding protein
MEQSVTEELDAFVDTLSEKLADCGMPEEDRDEIEAAGESAVEAIEARLENIEQHVQYQFNEIVENEKEIDDVQEQVEEVESTVEESNQAAATDGALTPEEVQELTPLEQASLFEPDEILNTQRSRETMERVLTIFENASEWGEKTRKGRVLRLADHNVKNLLEAELDTSLCWKQLYRACRLVERYTKGAFTFFQTDRHGWILCLHEHKDLYDRMERGQHPLTVSSAQNGGRAVSG